MLAKKGQKNGRRCNGLCCWNWNCFGTPDTMSNKTWANRKGMTQLNQSDLDERKPPKATPKSKSKPKPKPKAVSPPDAATTDVELQPLAVIVTPPSPSGVTTSKPSPTTLSSKEAKAQAAGLKQSRLRPKGQAQVPKIDPPPPLPSSAPPVVPLQQRSSQISIEGPLLDALLPTATSTSDAQDDDKTLTTMIHDLAKSEKMLEKAGSGDGTAREVDGLL